MMRVVAIIILGLLLASCGPSGLDRAAFREAGACIVAPVDGPAMRFAWGAWNDHPAALVGESVGLFDASPVVAGKAAGRGETWRGQLIGRTARIGRAVVRPDGLVEISVEGAPMVEPSIYRGSCPGFADAMRDAWG